MDQQKLKDQTLAAIDALRKAVEEGTIERFNISSESVPQLKKITGTDWSNGVKFEPSPKRDIIFEVTLSSKNQS
jgi:hypothetical protein